MAEVEPLPIVQGDWVATKGHHASIQIGRVKQSWREADGKVYMNVVIYAPSGEDVGRVSPACGGPKRFEPSLTFDDYWQRIERPRFPLRRKDMGVPSEKPGWVTLVSTYYHDDGDGGLRPKAVRTRPRKQSGDYPRDRVRIIRIPAEPTNKGEMDVAALRRSAQELRDLSKNLSEEGAQILLDRARELDAEAAKIETPWS
jgi:hypothetical protein